MTQFAEGWADGAWVEAGWDDAAWKAPEEGRAWRSAAWVDEAWQDGAWQEVGVYVTLPVATLSLDAGAGLDREIVLDDPAEFSFDLVIPTVDIEGPPSYISVTLPTATFELSTVNPILTLSTEDEPTAVYITGTVKFLMSVMHAPWRD